MTKPIEIFQCGICDHYHRINFYGDCRNDSERFVRDGKNLVSCAGEIKFGSESIDWVEVDNPDLTSEPMHGLDTPDTRTAYELYQSKALNAELLAALIQMESWATCFSTQLMMGVGPFTRDVEKARAVIAKAKELEL